MQENIQNFPFDNTFDKNVKAQKFFFRDLDIDLEEAAKILRLEYGRIERQEMFGIKEHSDEKDIFTYSKSLSTHKSREYNAFQMYYPFIHELYSAVVDMVLEACKYYEIDYNSEQWMCQAWFNINSKEKGGKLEWHDHIQPELHVPSFHGYYSVNAEPSETHYDINGETKINVNKNNRAILSLMGFPHAMGPWEWEGDRITIAYDVLPLKILPQEEFIKAMNLGKMEEHERFWEQHYFPLPKLIQEK
jgi:hypothetical protein